MLSPGATIPYYGPATLTWSGKLPSLPGKLPVFRYVEISRAQADAFAVRLHGTDLGEVTDPPLLASYDAPGFAVVILSSEPGMELEPRYVITSRNSAANTAADDDTMRRAAADFLRKYQLSPPWPNRVIVDRTHSPPQVVYNRVFDLGGATAAQVDSRGNPAGIEVTLNGSQVFQAEGPVPVDMKTGDYAALQASQAAVAAVKEPPLAEAGPIDPTPNVKLTRATLVYLAVPAGGHGFFEPALLFTGSFSAGGQAYEKRVLVPAVDVSLLLAAHA